MPTEIGKKFNGRYLILGNIGSGGMANVFLARDLILDREVAIKVLRYDFLNDQSAIRRFQREMLASTELVHPNIVTVYDAGQEGETQFLVMEYVKGMDLKRYIQTQYPIPYDRIVDIMQQILSAVALAHQHRIIHRDLKPQNILIDESGTVKITDFGIAVALSETSITQTNSMLGSVHYLSPEQARGSMATNQSDIYAIGIILYEMLTGKVPFDGESAVTIALKHFQEEIPSVRLYDRHVPQSLENVVLKATAKDPIDRYQSAEEMSADLATALDPSRLNEPAWHPANHVEETKVLPNLTEQMPTVAPVEEIVTKPEKEAEEKPVPSKKKVKDQQKPKSKKKLLFLGIAAVLVIGIATIAFSVLGGGKNEISVPDVSNLSESAARSKLQEAGLKAAGQTEEITSDKIPEGKVVKTNPEAKAIVQKGREVVLYISTGGRKIKMKDYTDMEYNEAVEALVKLDFKESKIKKKEEYSDTVEKGKIISQTPEANSEVTPDKTSVKFVVSKGVKPIKISDYVGMTINEALLDLANNGINESQVKQTQQESDKEAGTILSQTPSAGSSVTPGNTMINFVVSSGPNEVSVPDFTGMSKSEVQSAAKEAGLTVNFEEDYDTQVPAGQVIRSNPSAGEKVKKNSSVTVTLSKGSNLSNFTVDVVANFTGDENDNNGQTITIWLKDASTGDVRKQVQSFIVDASSNYKRVSVDVSVAQGGSATIYAQRDNGKEVSMDVSKATTIQVP
ncbi:Stk1 family PASTA domain-containing Ser/Thr kinase [Enterococcus cecorum]|uniref:Stk1 family PASTA domain-containing Ser/Thr kinase n=1 Tax=Enterococcus cecorum TaxID=44008 RepID=UPI001FAD51BB|nr:Stk1 family PASTA domain-containing Ser/Thr kinase [Enterococcus cecorum]MCJ0552736.1 Stk1 family PASTA domain-containing Ser/Thr kinase [Enterococcus cecorum]MCJ0556688.1 Stk1 family PASTA domain-containing Ser/Thr kinase [Enterococcus cecorum]MCJ0561322.1 Stk1 family PASTA domain-containing Ser/Thr kinase [Enterococcus cecorum]MCJ0563777.1 Stk1 family PASTA domain-containing Ser/Thr kinase [Enterococcus cecorum]MDZ5560152.1 Stk1 family PASTA domain-containing Ser/Thr kinase [Enterococcus 